RGRCANVGARRSSDTSHRLAGVLQRPLKTEVRVVRCRAEWPPGRRAEPAHRHGLRHGDAAERLAESSRYQPEPPSGWSRMPSAAAEILARSALDGTFLNLIRIRLATTG